MLIRKLGFLCSVLDGRKNVGSAVMGTLMDEVESVTVDMFWWKGG